MTFKANLLYGVCLSTISLFCAKVGKGLCRSLLAETDFLLSAIYPSEWFLGKAQKGDIL